MKHLVIIVVLALSAVSVFAQTEAAKAKISAEIRKVMEEQSDAWNSGDIDGFMKGYWRSDNLLFVSGDNVTLDRYKRSYDTREKMGTLAFSGLEITVLSKDAAVVLGSWELKRANDNPKGKFTLTFRKLKGDWRIILDHTS